MKAMKDSRVEWIGDIPQNWEIGRIKYNYYLKGRIGWQGLKADEFIDEGPYLVTGTDFENGKVNWNTCYHISQERYDEAPEIHVEKGDLLITKDGTVGKVAYVDEKPEKVSLNSHLLIMRPLNENYNNRFLFWTIQSPVFDKFFLLSQNGTIMASLSQGKINDFSFALPNSRTQKKIADYLDNKCAQIDEIVEKQQAIIEKLREYKLSVITEAVTKGLNPDVEMKDSGIEWVENIPEHWGKVKLKFCTYIRARLGWKGLKADEYVEEGYPLLSAFNIVNNKIDFENNINYINQFRFDESPEIKLSNGDILLVKDGAGIGKCGIIENLPVKSTTNGSLAVITVTKHLKPKFLYYYLLSSVFQKYIDRIKDGMGVPHLFQSDLKEIEIVFPSISEQKHIIENVDKKINKTDRQLQIHESFITKLEEYKKSLIYEVVTGKMEV